MMRPTILGATWNEKTTAEDGVPAAPSAPAQAWNAAVEGSPTASIQRGASIKKFSFEQELHRFGKEVSVMMSIELIPRIVTAS